MSKLNDEQLSYWQRREQAHALRQQMGETELADKMSENLKEAQRSINHQIQVFYERYASKEGISIEDAMERVKAHDVQAFAKKAAEYVKNKDFSHQANQDLRLYNATMKINRLELLKAEINLEIASATNENQKLINDYLTNEVMSEYRRQSGILGEHFSYNNASVEAIVNGSFDNAGVWKNTLWDNHAGFTSELGVVLRRSITQGANPRDVAAHFGRLFDRNSYEAKRLLVTEVARIQGDVQMDCYTKAGITQYVYLAEPSACKLCSGLDGEVFDVADRAIGKNCYPMHPFCKCSSAGYVDDAEEKVYSQNVFTMDLMAKQRTFTVGNDIRVKTKRLNGTDFDFWVQGSTKKIRDTVSNVQSSLKDLTDYKVPNVVFLKKSRLPGFAGYDYKQDILFVSDALHSEKEFAKILSDNYFAAQNIKDTMVHELTHKKHWDSAKAFYKANKKRYNDVEQAMSELNSPLVSYVKEQLKHDFNYLVKISPNADEAFILGNVNELVAEVSVLGDRVSDQVLYQKVKEVLSWK